MSPMPRSSWMTYKNLNVIFLDVFLWHFLLVCCFFVFAFVWILCLGRGREGRREKEREERHGDEPRKLGGQEAGKALGVGEKGMIKIHCTLFKTKTFKYSNIFQTEEICRPYKGRCLPGLKVQQRDHNRYTRAQRWVKDGASTERQQTIPKTKHCYQWQTLSLMCV